MGFSRALSRMDGDHWRAPDAQLRTTRQAVAEMGSFSLVTWCHGVGRTVGVLRFGYGPQLLPFAKGLEMGGVEVGAAQFRSARRYRARACPSPTAGPKS